MESNNWFLSVHLISISTNKIKMKNDEYNNPTKTFKLDSGNYR